MAQRIVDVFEAIHIHEEDSQVPVVPCGKGQRAGQSLGQQRAIREIGQGIMVREMR